MTGGPPTRKCASCGWTLWGCRGLAPLKETCCESCHHPRPVPPDPGSEPQRLTEALDSVGRSRRYRPTAARAGLTAVAHWSPPDPAGDILRHAWLPGTAAPREIRVRPALHALIAAHEPGPACFDVPLVVDDTLPDYPGYEIRRVDPGNDP